MANDQLLEGGPVWRESAWAFAVGCDLTGESNRGLGLMLPMFAGRAGTLADETVRLWRSGDRDAPFWAYLGLWRLLRGRGHDAGALRAVLGFEIAE